MNYVSTGALIRELREGKHLPLRIIAAQLNMDTSLYSKIERGEKKASKAQIALLESYFEVEKNQLLINYLVEIILNEISNEECAKEVLRAVEKQVFNR